MRKPKRQGRADKNKFRQSSVWKSFRLEQVLAKNSTCECCWRTLPTRSLQLHHLDPEHYEDLNPEKFAVLCRYCHEAVELLSRRKDLSILNPEYVNVYKKFITGDHTYYE